MSWKGERRRHALSARGVQTVRSVRGNPMYYKLTGDDEKIVTTRTIKHGSAAYYMGHFVGLVVAVDTIENLVEQGYDSNGVMTEYLDTSGYDEFDSPDEAGEELGIAVSPNGRVDEESVVYVLGGGGVTEVGKHWEYSDDILKKEGVNVYE